MSGNLFLLANIVLEICLIFVVVLTIVLSRYIRKSISNRIFVFFCVSVICWILANLLANLYSSDPALLLFWTRASLFGPCFLPIFYILFAISFPESSIAIKKGYLILLVAITSAILFFIPTVYNVKSVNLINANKLEYSFEPGILYTFFSVYFVVSFVIASYILFKKHNKANEQQKIQIRFIISGIVASSVSGSLISAVFPIMGLNSLISIGPASSLFFIALTTYAIIKHQLLNAKVIVTEAITYLVLIILSVELFFSRNTVEVLFRLLFLVIMTYGARILLISINKEIKQKEDLQVLSKKLDEANRHLEDLDEQKDNFISMASHELNTPIAAIEGYLSMIIDEKMAGDVNPKVKAYLENIYFSSKRLAALVRDLLNVSRIESGRVHLINEEASIEDVIEKSIAEVKIKADEVGHKLTFEKPKTPLPKTWFDVSRITEVMINIIGNAIKYTDPPGKITVSAHADDGKLVVAIQDNGRGIPKGKEEAIFEKFVQVEVLKDQVKGTGLGMFITKNLIELHKGKIWFKSSTEKADHGTTFYFSLPIYKTKPVDPHEGEGALFQKKPSDVTAPVTSPTRPPIPTTTFDNPSSPIPEACKTDEIKKDESLKGVTLEPIKEETKNNKSEIGDKK